MSLLERYQLTAKKLVYPEYGALLTSDARMIPITISNIAVQLTAFGRSDAFREKFSYDLFRYIATKYIKVKDHENIIR
jgi:hypothetical protein